MGWVSLRFKGVAGGIEEIAAKTVDDAVKARFLHARAFTTVFASAPFIAAKKEDGKYEMVVTEGSPKEVLLEVRNASIEPVLSPLGMSLALDQDGCLTLEVGPNLKVVLGPGSVPCAVDAFGGFVAGLLRIHPELGDLRRNLQKILHAREEDEAL